MFQLAAKPTNPPGGVASGPPPVILGLRDVGPQFDVAVARSLAGACGRRDIRHRGNKAAAAMTQYRRALEFPAARRLRRAGGTTGRQSQNWTASAVIANPQGRTADTGAPGFDNEVVIGSSRPKGC